MVKSLFTALFLGLFLFYSNTAEAHLSINTTLSCDVTDVQKINLHYENLKERCEFVEVREGRWVCEDTESRVILRYHNGVYKLSIRNYND